MFKEVKLQRKNRRGKYQGYNVELGDIEEFLAVWTSS
jgi:hypothetical protein